jgi:hypothetical protein
MSLCEFCVSFNPDKASDGKVYLPNRSLLVRNAARGCGGCRSFQDLLEETLSPGTELDGDCRAFLEMNTSNSLGYGNISYDLTGCKPNRIQLQQAPSERQQVPRDPTVEHCLRMIRSWEVDCRSHGCHDRRLNPLPKRIIIVPIDDEFPRLHDTGDEIGSFVALTHCWGKTPMTKLLQELEAAWHHGIDPSSLSQNFQDALRITKLLGYRYLWIDALCIVQDSTEDWQEQAPKMAEVYSNANLVLSAAFASDSTEGFLGYRPSVVTPNLGLEPSYSVIKAFLVEGPNEMSATMEHIYKSIIDMSPLNSRGWCAQERMMATRVLHYTPYGMIWECSRAYWPEVETPQVSMEDLYRNGGNTNMLTSAEHDIENYINAWLRKKQQGQYYCPSNTETDTDAALQAWTRCVCEYASRDLTKGSDKLPAIAALAEIFSDALGDYLGGIWTKSLQRSLSWTLTWTPAGVKFPDTYRAPSWSWASLDGPIEYNCEFRPSCSPWWSDCEDFVLLKHHFVPGQIANPYMSIGQGSCIVLEARCIDARTVSLVSDDKMVYCRCIWDDLKHDVHASAWPSLQDVPAELILLPLQKKKFLHENGLDVRMLDLFALLLCEVSHDDVHSQGPSTFRRVGSSTISIKHENDSDIFADAIYHTIRWETRQITLI